MEALQKYGCRVTQQRLTVLSVLAQSPKHLTADQVLQRARRVYPLLNKSVVYRNLELLTGLGLVSRTDLGQGRVEYELHRHPHHHHLVCRRCHRTIEAVPETFAALGEELTGRYGFAADLDHLAIFGLCRRCRSRKSLPRAHHPHLQPDPPHRGAAP
ncbi:MAG TPA: Fur family transcriptional regulator [Acidimicrobiales bacterium]|nr:Fur family transcriptional regulator [Acidimicrobiales bacterium]